MGRLADAVAEGVAMPDAKRRQILKLDQEFSALEAENKVLKAENGKLQALVNPLQRKVDELQARIKRQDSATLDEVSERLLSMLANSDSDTVVETFISHLKLSKAKGDYHLDILSNKNFARLGAVDPHGHYWNVTPAGREYLAQRDLL